MKRFFCAMLTVAASVGAVAQDIPLQFVGAIMFTSGGDKLYSGTYTNGSTYDITSGGTVAFNAGASYAVTPLVDVQVTLGYHTSSTSATNGNIDFTRYPLEIMGFYKLNDQFRLGAGARSAMSAKTSTSGVAASLGNFEFKPAIGSIIELQYLLGNQPEDRNKNAFTLRYVAESYTEKTSSLKINGNHVGLGFIFYR